MRAIYLSLVLAFGFSSAQPLCCCAAGRADEDASASTCCPREASAADQAQEDRPCGESGPCEDCNTFSLIALASRHTIEFGPQQNDLLSLMLRPALTGRILNTQLVRSRQPDRIQFTFDPSPPFLCVFLT
jgi:hypothetical protein